MTATTFPRIKSVGLQGAKAVAKEKLTRVTIKGTNGYFSTREDSDLVVRKQGTANGERKALSKKRSK